MVSLLLLPLTLYFFSPAQIIAGAATGVVSGSFMLFALLFASSLFLRRGFCGWVCPGAGLQESCVPARDRRVAGGRYNWTKYGIWVPWIGTTAMVAWGAGGFQSVDPFFSNPLAASVVDRTDFVIYLTVYLTVVGLIAAPALVVGRRAFCHYVCWMAPFMVIGTRLRDALKWPSLQLVADTSKCQTCKTCSRNCPMSLDVNKLVQSGSMAHSECILCGTCADNCPRQVIRYSFKGG